MIITIDHQNREEYQRLVEEAQRLRHRVFVEERGWEALRTMNGHEADAFDTPEAVEMLYVLDGKVVGYQRILQTTQPHLLSDVYPQLCEGPHPRSPDLREWTRFAVEESVRAGPAGNAISLDLTIALVEWGLTNGVTGFIVQTETVHLLRFVSCHFMVRPLGLPQRIGRDEIVAILARFDRRTLERLLELRGRRDSRRLFDGLRR